MLHHTWTIEDLKNINAKDWAVKNSHMYFRAGVPNEEELCFAVLSDGVLKGASLWVAKVADWWCFSSNTDWLPQTTDAGESLFLKMTSIEGQANSVRSEFLIATFARSYFCLRNSKVVVQCGNPRPAGTNEFIEQFPNSLLFEFNQGNST